MEILTGAFRGVAATVGAGASPTWSALPKKAVNQNRLPRSGSLSTPISPPNSSTNCLEIASPSPVPPYLRVLEVSAWVNLSNTRS